MTSEQEITIEAPLALRYLIEANNQLLNDYQKKLLAEIQEAVLQMMSILNIDAKSGWKFDMERMVYIKTQTSTEE